MVKNKYSIFVYFQDAVLFYFALTNSIVCVSLVVAKVYLAYKLESKSILTDGKLFSICDTQNANWIEVYERSRISGKQSFLIAIKLEAMSQIKISDYCKLSLLKIFCHFNFSCELDDWCHIGILNHG